MSSTSSTRAGTAPTAGASSPGAALARAHILPDWYLGLQRHVFMPLLVLVTGSIMGQLLMQGFAYRTVLDTWTIGISFALGLLFGGMTVLCSVGMVVQWRQGHRLVALTLLAPSAAFFALAELWAGIVARPALIPNRADQLVAGVLGQHALPVTPTALLVAALPSVMGIIFGLLQLDAAPTRTLDEERESLERRLLRAQYEGQIRAAQAAGLGGALRAAREGWRVSANNAPAAMETEMDDPVYAAPPPGWVGSPLSGPLAPVAATPWEAPWEAPWDQPGVAGPSVRPPRAPARSDWLLADARGTAGPASDPLAARGPSPYVVEPGDDLTISALPAPVAAGGAASARNGRTPRASRRGAAQ